MTMQSKSFLLEESENKLSSIVHPDDKHGMNWIESTHKLGDTIAPGDVKIRRSVTLGNEYLELCVAFSNENDYDLLLQKGALGIYVPFNDSYGKASICMTQRCHAHLNTCGSSSYIMGLRMGGDAPHLGMLLCEGELAAYSIERENKSNDRGDFILHPPFVHLMPKQSYTVRMKFFWHEGKEDFLGIIAKEKNFITVTSSHFTYFKGEDIRVSASVAASELYSVSAILDGISVPFEQNGSVITVNPRSDVLGEHNLIFKANGKTASCVYYVSEGFDEIVRARCVFLAERQQFNCEGSSLDGAFLSYDNEENTPVYDFRRRDINSSRERIAMPLLILLYLKHYGKKLSKEKYGYLHEKLMKFVTFFKREIYDESTGTVSNDVGYENSKVRLYNYPWPTRFFLELYELEGDKKYLFDAYNILREYYRLGGKNFYAFTIPIVKMISLLGKAGYEDRKQEMISYFREHAEIIIANASDYPAHEVSYEQSIVAPAAEFLLQMYFLTKEERYLAEAEKQLATASLFSGIQPNYHLYMCAIRHWDGFWFGKRRLYGDTFPHYWSVLSANAFYDYAKASGKGEYFDMAEDALRGQLCQFTPDGRATCATLFPLKVNGNPASYRDPWANDQDWALVYYLDYLSDKGYFQS